MDYLDDTKLRLRDQINRGGSVKGSFAEKLPIYGNPKDKERNSSVKDSPCKGTVQRNSLVKD